MKDESEMSYNKLFPYWDNAVPMLVSVAFLAISIVAGAFLALGLQQVPEFLLWLTATTSVIGLIMVMVCAAQTLFDFHDQNEVLIKSKQELDYLKQSDYEEASEINDLRAEIMRIDQELKESRLFGVQVCNGENGRVKVIKALVNSNREAHREQKRLKGWMQTKEDRINLMERYCSDLLRYLLCLGRELFKADPKQLKSHDLMTWRRQVVTRVLGLVALLNEGHGSDMADWSSQLVADLIPRDAVRDVFALLVDRGLINCNRNYQNWWSMQISLWLSGAGQEEPLHDGWNHREMGLMIPDWPLCLPDTIDWTTRMPNSPGKDKVFSGNPAYTEHLRLQLTMACRIIGYWPSEVQLPDGVTSSNVDLAEIVDKSPIPS
jgi:hypothetical protein